MSVTTATITGNLPEARNSPSEVVYVKDVFPPLIDRELYERVTHQMDLNTFGLGKDGHQGGQQEDSCSAVLSCAVCVGTLPL